MVGIYTNSATRHLGTPLMHNFSAQEAYIWHQHPPQVMAKNHWHNHIEFNYIYNGQMMYQLADTQYIFPAGQLVLFWAGIPHRVQHIIPPSTNKTVELCNIHLPLEHLLCWDNHHAILQPLLQGRVMTLDVPPSYIVQLLNIWRDDIKQRGQKALGAIGLELQALFDRFSCTTLAPPLTQTNPAIWNTDKDVPAHLAQKQRIALKILYFILEHLTHPLNSQMIAKHLGFHNSYLQRIFKEFLGVSIHQFTMQMRAQYAASLLRDTGHSISNIAIESGFGSISQFYNVFQQHYQQSPKQYRLGQS